ncbi:T9SS type A sorting domain-containing protein [Moheibacter sediminis]|uniref:Major paralogous domain-containing protein/Por secretion system C-terminal sorting domain-containing protein n=1 Tax=Moheibacter sediminis TaxID=1434700 RepID=A0A1W1YID0_9FLAO|nr:T9SS type A sorting domain-containing protein [Moheibacter sediminis]SMC35927.1 major paralogous domain-containing protein/Por secretion system C-terminal sorting domain-containing protein [Moheibacter sediminis]
MKVIYSLAFFLLATIGFGQSNEFPAPYCQVDLAYIYAHPITLVQFAGIQQSSTNDIWTSEHENFTDVTGEVEQGKNYSIKIKANTSGDFYTAVRLFIDWNQNDEFEENEFYDLGWLKNTDGTEDDLINDETINYILTDIDVPADAILGETRMRVINIFSYARTIPDEPMYSGPCGWDDIDNYGQAEDYTILVKTTTNVVCEPSEPGENIGDTGCVNLTYQGQTVGYQTVRAADGNIWLQQNLGSVQTAESIEDEAARGDYFQWGRWDDGHQLKDSEMSEVYPTPNNPAGLGSGTEIFYIGGGSPYSEYTGWFANPNQNDTWTAATLEEVTEHNGMDPCKAIGNDWEIPTEADWDNVLTLENIFPAPTGSSNNGITRGFESNLKIAGAGARKDDSFAFEGQRAYIWTKSASSNPDFYGFVYLGTYAGSTTGFGGDAKSHGYSVRCVKKGEVMSVSDLTKSNVLVYPNPTNGIVYFNAKEKVKKLELYNLNGQKIKESNDANINLSSFVKGVYLIKVTLENNTQQTLKIVKN